MLVFVYGTLKQTHGNHMVIGRFNPTLIGDKVAVQNYSMASLGAFPAAYPDNGGTIMGELYEVGEEALQPLDRLEGYPGFYDRTEVETEHGNALMYFIDQENLRTPLNKVESGWW